MSDPVALLHRTTHAARRRAGLVLWIEQLWPVLLLPAFLLGGFALLSLLTLPQRLPGVLHALLLLLLFGAEIALLRRGLRGLSSPPRLSRDRRIERASRLPHRPLSTLADRPAPGIGIGMGIGVGIGVGVGLGVGVDPVWRAHLERTRALTADAGRLGAGRPLLSWRAHDRHGAGAALLAALVLALLLSGTAAPLRLLSGFWPGVALPLGPRPVLQAWITPPPFAGGAPVFLFDPHGRFSVPAGSVLALSLSGSDATPSLRGLSGRFTALSPTSWSLSRTLPATGPDGIVLHLREAGYALADWRIVSEAAPLPSVSWAAPPGADTVIPWRLRLPWAAGQRFGVQSLVAEIRLADGHGDRVLRVPIPLNGAPKQAHGVALADLSADPWAGAHVTARLVATDTSGRSARSDAAGFVLPSRPFHNPLARAVLDVRRRLATGSEPPVAAADDLAALGDTPGLIAQDSALFLNLSAVASLLRQSDAVQLGSVTGEAVDRLWSLALALEDGLHNNRAGARAAAEIRRAQDRLSAQIEHMRQLGAAGQSQAEQDTLRQRIAELAQAIRRKMQALAAEAAHAHQPMPALPQSMTQGGDALSRMLQQMQQQAAGGHADEAIRNLSRMQQMLDHMRLATPQDLRDAAEQAQATAQARDQMQAVQDLVQRQTALLDSAQGRQGALDRATQDRSRQIRGDDEAASGGQADAATRALLQQLGIPLDGQAGGDTAGGDTAGGETAGGETSGDGQGGDQNRDQAGGQNRGQNRGQDGADAGARRARAPSAGMQDDPRQATARARDAYSQNVLSRALGELAHEFTGLTGKKADGLANAVKAMDQARDALANGRDGDAAAAQAEALAALQKGRNQMSAAMRGGRSNGNGLALLPGTGDGSGQGTADAAGEDGSQQDGALDGGDNGSGAPGEAAELGDDNTGPRDPLGRPTGDQNGASGDGDETRLPTGDQAARSRQIEQELRRRDSDRTRPQGELDYLDRLLKAF